MGKGFLKRADPRVKLLWLLSVAFFSLASTNPLFLLSLFAIVFSLLALERLPLSGLKGPVKFFIMLSAIALVAQGFFYPVKQTELFSFLGTGFYLEGLFFGIVISLRLFVLVFSSALFAMTTNPEDLMAGLGRLPPEVGFSFATAVKSVPILREELTKIKLAQQARGYRRGFSGLFSIIVPLLSKSLEKARWLAFSAEARGFGREKITWERKPAAGDIIFLGLSILVFTALFLAL